MLVKRIIIGGLLAVGLVASIVAPAGVAAQTVTEARCALAKQRLEVRLVEVAAAQKAHTETYTKLTTKAGELASSARAAGYDTTALEAANRSAETKISDFTTKATTYEAALEVAQQASCADEGATFATALAAARNNLTTVRTATTDVETVFNKDIIPALQGYAKWLKERAATTQENE